MPYDIFGNKIKGNPLELGFGTPSKRKPERDSRRAFNQTQRKEILYQQDMKCAKCHGKLDPRDIEYDHKKPWAAKGRTISTNGRAVCGSCHNKITHKQRLKKAEKSKKGKAKSKTDSDNLLGLSGFKPPKIKLF